MSAASMLRFLHILSSRGSVGGNLYEQNGFRNMFISVDVRGPYIT